MNSIPKQSITSNTANASQTRPLRKSQLELSKFDRHESLRMDTGNLMNAMRKMINFLGDNTCLDSHREVFFYRISYILYSIMMNQQ